MANNCLAIKSGFLRVPAGLGIGRYVCQLQRITLKFCKSFGSSRGMRDFIEYDLVNYAKENPGVVVYVKPRRHRTPVICAEYLGGSTQWVPVKNYSRDDIIKWMELLRTQYHDNVEMRYRKLWHTDFPSIQGPWTPFLFRDPIENITQYPDKKLGSAKKIDLTASEKLVELFQKQQLADKEENEECSVQKVPS